MSGAQGWGLGGEMGVTANEYGVSFWDNKKCSKIDYGDDCITL